MTWLLRDSTARPCLSWYPSVQQNQSEGALDGLPTPSAEVEIALAYQREQQENLDQESGCLRVW